MALIKVWMSYDILPYIEACLAVVTLCNDVTDRLVYCMAVQLWKPTSILREKEMNMMEAK